MKPLGTGWVARPKRWDCRIQNEIAQDDPRRIVAMALKARWDVAISTSLDHPILSACRGLRGVGETAFWSRSALGSEASEDSSVDRYAPYRTLYLLTLLGLLIVLPGQNSKTLDLAKDFGQWYRDVAQRVLASNPFAWSGGSWRRLSKRWLF